jgi:hypothetical protein
MLKFGYDETNEVFVNSRNVAYGNNKTIARTLDQPLFELVRNSLWRPNDRIMPHWAPATVPLSTHAPAWP